MRVKIISCTPTWGLYKNKIGDTLTIDPDEIHNDCYSYVTAKRFSMDILKSDCEIIPEENPQPEPFDLERALKGEKVIDKSGLVVSEIVHIKSDITLHPVVACINGVARFYSLTGIAMDGKDYLPLFMAPKEPQVVTRYINIYREGEILYTVKNLYDSIEQAHLHRSDHNYVTTVPVTITLNK